MGHRAYIILIKNNGKRSFHYSRHGAKYLDSYISGGPAELTNFIHDETSITETEWLSVGGGDDGGLLLDFQQQVLIWYGESETSWDPTYRQIFLKVVPQFWENWDIRWAYNKYQDILEYAGYPKIPLNLDSLSLQRPRSRLDPARDGLIKHPLPGILSIIDSNQQCRLIPLSEVVYSYLLSGPAFFSNWKEVPQLESLLIDTIPIPFYEETKPDVPQECWGGIHLNLLEQKLDYWAQYFNQGIEQLIFPMWPGWEITIHYDEFEWQEKITKGALSFKVKSKKEILAEMLPLGVWSEKPRELDDQEIEETIAKLATRPYGPTLIIKILVYLILAGILILFLWVLVG